MDLLAITRGLALLAALFAAGALAYRWHAAQRLPWPADRSPARGSPLRGVAYAFTLGMAPWAKESTRRHGAAYLRGIAFHAGIFAALAALLVSPAWTAFPALARAACAGLAGLGALCGLAGLIARRAEPNLRALSTPDDYAAVALVTAFLAACAAALVDAAWLPAAYAATALMLVYVPLGKIRHCLYYFFSRRFFGLFVGRRAIIHPGEPR